MQAARLARARLQPHRSEGTTSASRHAHCPQIITKAVHDLSLVSSVRMAGTEVSSGQGFAVDITVVRGQGCRGTMAMPMSGYAFGDTADPVALVYLNGTAHMTYDQTYMKKMGVPASTITAVAGKYLETSSPSVTAHFVQACELSAMVSGLNKDDTGFTKDGTAAVDGQFPGHLDGAASNATASRVTSRVSSSSIACDGIVPTS